MSEKREQVEVINALVSKAGNAGSADEALKYSQAALNAANAIGRMLDYPDESG